MEVEECLGRLGCMESAIVADDQKSLAGVARQERHEEQDKLGAALAVGQRIGEFAGSIVDGTVDDLLLIQSWCRDFRLLALGSPHACEMRMQMHFHLILVDQFERGIVLEGLFFRRSRRAAALT